MRKFIALGFCFLSWSANAQKDTIPVIPVDLSDSRLNRPFLDFFTEQGGASKQWSTTQLYSFFYTDFVNDDQKNAMMNRSQPKGLAIGSLQSFDFRLSYEGHHQSRLKPFPKRSIYLFNRSFTCLGMSADLSRLMLYGNKGTAGSPQDIGGFKFESWFYSGIGHQYTFMVDTVPVSLGLGLVALHSMEDYSTGTASLYTEPDGSSINFAGDYQIAQSIASSAYGITGWGLSLNIESAERYKAHELRIGVHDLGVVYMQNSLAISRDSSFRFAGIDAGNLFSFSEDRFNDLIDSLSQGLVGGQKAGAWKMLPFKIHAEYRYHLKNQFIYSQVTYRFISTYTPRIAMGYGYSWDNFDLQSGLAYGGFNGLSLDLGMRWRFNRRWHLRGGLSNLFGVALPTWSGGTIGNFGLRYIF